MEIIGEDSVETKLDKSYRFPVEFRKVLCANKNGKTYIRTEKITHLIDEFGNRITSKELFGSELYR